MGIAVLVGSLLAAATAGAQTQTQAQPADEVRVEGRTYRGTIVETRPRISVRLRLAGGDELTVPWSEIVSVDGAPRESLESGTPPLPAPERAALAAPRTHWYGWQTLVADGASVSLLFSPFTAIVGLSGFVVASPVIHFAHGQVGSGVGSAALRLAMPVGGALMGLEVASKLTSPNSPNALGDVIMGGLAGAFLGIIGASAIDASLLAWEPARAPSATKGATQAAPSIALMPVLSPSTESRASASVVGVTLVGSF